MDQKQSFTCDRESDEIVEFAPNMKETSVSLTADKWCCN